MSHGPAVGAWQALRAAPRFTTADGRRPGWTRALVPARDSSHRWSWLHLVLVVPTAYGLATSPAGDTQLDQYVALVASAVLVVFTVRRSVLALGYF